MAEKVKIFEIARRIGITSGELVALCQRGGFAHIKHHSNVVAPDEAEKIRKTAIRLYKPKAPAPPKKTKAKTAPPAKPEARKKPEKQAAKPAEQAKPVEPPKPRGKRAGTPRRPRQVWAEARRAAQADQSPPVARAGAEGAPAGVKERRPGRGAQAEPKRERRVHTRRTVVFKDIRRLPPKKRETKIQLTPPVSVRDLSERMGVPAGDIIKRLMLDHKVLATINQTLEREVIELVGLDCGVEITFKEERTAEDLLKDALPEDRPEDKKARAPVIALLGHVDHGKTSILDCIRHTQVAGTEDGGITQDIGAWQITHKGHDLTFVDTPGHEAFTAMRARGAQVTDIVILVIAADDGVMPQTEEAVSHAQAAQVPIVVAMNKVDKPDANVARVKQQLSGFGLNPEEWGGHTGCVEVCALTGQGIDDLIERVMLEAELLELSANPDRPASGVALEARVEEGRGVVANMIVHSGTLRPGDILVCGQGYGRVRSLVGGNGQEVPEAAPSVPVSVSGLNRLPDGGDAFFVVADLDLARSVAEHRFSRMQQERRQPRVHVTLENLYESLAAGREERLRLVVKVDVIGSMEPLVSSFERMGDEEARVKILHRGVGDVNISDVLLADASDAVIVAFRVATDERAGQMAKECGVDTRYYRVIYEAAKDVRDALEGLLAPELREEALGGAEVRQMFRVSRVGNVAGCYVRSGKIRRGARARVLRDGNVLYEGTIAGLRREKDDAREVESGFECGIRLDHFQDVQVGDMIECFTIREVKRVLS